MRSGLRIKVPACSLYGYGGDILNFDMAGDLVESTTSRTVLLTDDVAPATRGMKRRGVGGRYAF